MVSSIHDQVLAHDGQTDEAKVTTGRRSGKTGGDTGQSSAAVSKSFHIPYSRWGEIEKYLHCLISHDGQMLIMGMRV